MMKKGLWKSYLFASLWEVVLVFALFFAGFLFYSYILANAPLFETLSLIQYGTGIEKLWLTLFFGSALGFYFLFCLLVLELILLILRTMMKTFLNVLELTKNKPLPKARSIQKNLSLVSLLKLMKVTSLKKGFIVYAIVIGVIWGSGLLGKAILKGNDSLVYRSYEYINLDTDLYEQEMQAEILNQDTYEIVIETGVGNVFVYQLDNVSKAQILFSYDNDTQKDTFTYEINTETNQIVVQFQTDVSEYNRYQEDVLPSVEIYLPADLQITALQVDITSFGNLTMEYIDTDKLDFMITGGKASIELKNKSMDELSIQALNSDVTVQILDVKNADLYFSNSKGNLRITNVDQNLTLDVLNQSDVFFYNCMTYELDYSLENAKLEMREVYMTSLNASIHSGNLIHVNSNTKTQPITIAYESVDATTFIKGIVYDKESE